MISANFVTCSGAVALPIRHDRPSETQSTATAEAVCPPPEIRSPVWRSPILTVAAPATYETVVAPSTYETVAAPSTYETVLSADHISCAWNLRDYTC